jgi:hypothetical protein
MAAIPIGADRWRFLDYGTLQVLQDTLTGEALRVHGDGAVFADGPFALTFDAAYPGRPVLLGIDGDDGNRSLHFADDEFSLTVAENHAARSQGVSWWKANAARSQQSF